MKKVGAFGARTHLSALLDEVARGAEIVITQRGIAAARPVPAGPQSRGAKEDTIARTKALARHQTLGRVSGRTLRDEGRR